MLGNSIKKSIELQKNKAFEDSHASGYQKK